MNNILETDKMGLISVKVDWKKIKAFWAKTWKSIKSTVKELVPYAIVFGGGVLLGAILGALIF